MDDQPKPTEPNPIIQAYMRGWEARRIGVVVGDNPYQEDDPLFWRWMQGWTDNGFRKLKKVANA